MKLKYRPEVDGLRAVAVLPVMLYHAGITAFSGGYVGVDVFFVISGYLITGIILSESASGTFSVAGFYERRARRILPALGFVILACLPAAWLLLPPQDLVDFAKSTMSVAVFSSNIYFKNSGGYFDATSDVRPLLHTWSLGVEEQFYVIFPLFLIVMRRRVRRYLIPAMLLTLAASIGLAQWAALFRPTFAFYLLPARAWELMIGGLIAVWAARSEQMTPGRGGMLATVMSLIGLGMIMFAVGKFDGRTLMPGLPALVPTVGAALIVIYASADNIVGRVLGSRLLAGIGLISYSAYLWHQPLLAFTRWASLTTPPTGVVLLAAGLALPMAYVSWRYIERPFRDRRRFTRRQIAAFATAVSLVMFAAGAAGTYSRGFPARFNLAAPTVASLEPMRRLPGCMDAEGMDRRPDWMCRIGSANGDSAFLVVGDSHAMALEPAFDSAGRALGVSGLFTAMSACPPIVHVFRPGRPLAVRECHDWNDRVMRFVQDHRIPLVVLVARWSAFTDGGYAGSELLPLSRVAGAAPSQATSRQAVSDGLRETVAALARAGARVVIVPQVPEQIVREPYKAYIRLADLAANAQTTALRSFSVSRTAAARLEAFTANLFGVLASSSHVQLADLSGQLCDGDRCLIGTTLESWYRDNHHLSPVGAMHVADRVTDVLRASLPTTSRRAVSGVQQLRDQPRDLRAVGSMQVVAAIAHHGPRQ